MGWLFKSTKEKTQILNNKIQKVTDEIARQNELIDEAKKVITDLDLDTLFLKTSQTNKRSVNSIIIQYKDAKGNFDNLT